MSRQIAIVIALLAAAVVLVAAMAWSTAARGQAPPGDGVRVEQAVTDAALRG